MRAGNPALACTLCFCLPGEISFLTSSPIISRSCETFLNSQTNFLPSRPNFWAAGNFPK